MKPWKTVVGLGAACAACCALPLLGVSAGGATFGAALAALADGLLPAALLLATALALAGIWWLRRRQAARRPACACGEG